MSKTFFKVLEDISSKFHYCNQNPQNIHTVVNSAPKTGLFHFSRIFPGSLRQRIAKLTYLVGTTAIKLNKLFFFFLVWHESSAVKNPKTFSQKE